MPTIEDIREWVESGDYERIVREGLPEKNLQVRFEVVNALGRRANTDDLVHLFGLIQEDHDLLVARRAVDVLSNPLGENSATPSAKHEEDEYEDDRAPTLSPPVPEDPPLLFYDDDIAFREFTRALRATQGKRYEYLCELLDICKPEDARKAIYDLKVYSCPMVIDCGVCGMRDVIVRSNTVFVGYHFVPTKRKWLRKAIENALSSVEKETGRIFTPVYADFRIGHVLCDICMGIQSCAAAIFDLESADPRPNVALEIGLGYGLRKKCIPLFAKKYKAQADIAGFGGIIYSDYKDLEKQLAKNLPDVLKAEV